MIGFIFKLLLLYMLFLLVKFLFKSWHFYRLFRKNVRQATSSSTTAHDKNGRGGSIEAEYRVISD
ncbi:MAG: hypothetical protein KAQ98_00120 [Bacteriovoracaceae bacterium]|nr:hypothetical protein [Bacteriovoracaceae bacterium]